jgi:DNA polymerase-3 subunit epsilon
VGLKCIEKFGWEKYFDDLVKFQSQRLDWKNFSLHDLQSQSAGHAIICAIEQGKTVELSYRNKNDNRIVKPFGVVRNPSGDYMVAYQPPETQQKRFYFSKIVSAKL